MGISVLIGTIISGITTGGAMILSGAVGAGLLVAGFNTLLLIGLSKGLGALLPGRPSGKLSLQSRTLSQRGTDQPQIKIYGEALVAAQTIAFQDTAGSDNEKMWTVHIMAGHEVDTISDVYFDERQITNSIINGGAAAGGAVDSGTYGPTSKGNTVEIYKEYGTSTQAANSALDTAFGSSWTSSHRLRGIAYIVTMYHLNKKTDEIWQGGPPRNVKALIKGAKVYDPRLDSTAVIDTTTSPYTMGSGAHRNNDSSTWAWSDNPALCTADFLMDSRFSPLAGGIDPDRIDWESVAKAADDCDTLVFVPPAASPSNTEKRFTCNGVVYGSATAEQNLADLLSSFMGDLVFSSGKYYVNAGTYTAPATGDDLDEDDIIGPLKIATSSEQRFNTVKANYIDKDMLYEPTETIGITKTAYKDTRDNGQEIIENIVLPMTDSWYMAQRICLKLLDRTNEELSIQVPCNLKAARFVPGQRINVTVTELGWSPKVFKVLDWSIFDRGGNDIGVNLDLVEDQSAAYADPVVGDYNTKTAAGALAISQPGIVPGIDTLPRGINYGEGAWNIRIVKNSPAASPQNGNVELQINHASPNTSGTYALPDGSTRTLSSNLTVETPYSQSTTPSTEGVFYIVWGSQDLNVRFSASPEYFETTQAASGIFAAIYDRFENQWYAVSNGNDEIAFTPGGNDYLVARGLKTSASGGIDTLTAVVSYVENPDATVGAQLGKDVLNTAGQILKDIDVRNDQLVAQALGAINFNGSFEIPRTEGITGRLMPAGWLLFGWNVGTETGINYEDEDLRDTLQIDPSAAALANNAIRVNPDTTYEVSVLAKGDKSTADLTVKAFEYNSDTLPANKYAIGVTGFLLNEGGIQDEDAEQTIISATDIGTSYAIHTATYEPGASAKWFSIAIYPPGILNSPQAKLLIDWAIIREKSSRNDRLVTLETDNFSDPASPFTGVHSESFTFSLDIARPIRIVAQGKAGGGSVGTSSEHWTAKLYDANSSPRTFLTSVSFVVADGTGMIVKSYGGFSLSYAEATPSAGNNTYELEIDTNGHAHGNFFNGQIYWSAIEDSNAG